MLPYLPFLNCTRTSRQKQAELFPTKQLRSNEGGKPTAK